MYSKMIRNLMVFEKLFNDQDEVPKNKDERKVSTMVKYLYGDGMLNSKFCSMKELKNIEKEYVSHPDMTDELRKHLQQKFSTKFNMNERKQMQTMKLWLNYMKEEFVDKEDATLLNQLRNSQIIM